MLDIKEQKNKMRVWKQFVARPSSLPFLVEWYGFLQPMEGFQTYTIRIVYFFPLDPSIWVIDPPIDLKAPHLNYNNSLCLYYKDDSYAYKWTPHKYISDTIIPWTSLWLMFYEIWLIEKEWYGPEAPHGNFLGDSIAKFEVLNSGRKR